MLERLEKVTKSQKLRMMMLFAVLAVVAAVAVFAFDEDVGEYLGQFGTQDYYSEYVDGQGAVPSGDEYEAYIPSSENDTIYIPVPTPGVPTPGQVQEEPPGATPGQIPGETPGQLETPSPTPLPGDDGNEAGIEGDGGYEAYEEFDPAGGYIEFVPFGGGDTVTFITNNPHTAAPTPAPGQGTRVTAANGQIGAINMPNTPTWGGRYFMQWNTSPDGTGTVFTGTTNVAGNMTVYAQWAFEVSFHGSGVVIPNTGSPANQTNPTWYGVRRIPLNTSVNANNAHVNPAFQAVWPTNPNIAGFEFLGWWTLPGGSGGGGSLLTGASVISAETGAFAHWDIDIRTVTFNPGTGTIDAGHQNTRVALTGNSINWSGQQARLQFRQNTAATWPRTAPAASRPAVDGTPVVVEAWWTQTGGWNGTGTRFAPLGTSHTYPITAISGPAGWADTAVTDNITVHAHWVHRIRFNVNGGSMGDRFPGASGIIQNQTSSTQSLAYIDIPADTPAAQKTVAQSGVRHRIAPASPVAPVQNHVPFNWLPTCAVNGTAITVNTHNTAGNPVTVTTGNIMSRPGHTFGGWWVVNGGQSLPLLPAAVGAVNHPANLGHTEFTPTTNISVLTHANSTIVAHWIPNPLVTITLNPNGGTFAVGGATPFQINNITTGSTIANCSLRSSGMPTFPTQPGYLFAGWHQAPNIPVSQPLGAVMARTSNPPPPLANPGPNERFTQGTTVYQSQTFYARWLPYVTVEFEQNFPSPSNPNAVRNIIEGWTMSNMHTLWSTSTATGAPTGNFYSTSLTIAAGPGGFTNNQRGSFTLLGFNRNPAGTGGTFPIASQVMSSTDPNMNSGTGRIHIYAAWGATLTFSTNHNDVYPIILNQTTTRSLVVGHTVGNSWQHQNHPNASGTASNNFPGLNVWAGNPYPGGGATARTLAMLGPNGTGSPLVSRSFVGWNTMSNGTGDWWWPDTIMANGPVVGGVDGGNRTLHAIWRPQVNFRAGIGIPETALSVPFLNVDPVQWFRMFQMGQPINAPVLGGAANNPPDMTNAWPGHQWRGWFPNSNGTGAMQDFSGNLLFARTYYASFYAPVYFHGNGGMITGNSFTQVPIGHQLLQAMPATLFRQGWSHVGQWNTNPANTGDSYDQFTPIMGGRNLHASWHARIEFLGGGGVVLAANAERFVPEGFTLDENPPGQRMPPNPTHPNPAYEFAGWRITTSENGHPDLTGAPVYFTDNMRFNETLAANTANGNIEVTAQWQRVDINITFDFNGGVRNYGGTDHTTRTYSMPRGTPIADRFMLFDEFPGDPITAITRANYTFTGEWLNPAILAPAPNIFTNAQVLAQTPIVATTFIAQWAPNPFTVTFQLDSGTYTVGAGAANPGPIVVNNVLHGTTIGYLTVPATRPVGPGVPAATTLARTGHSLVGWQEVDASNDPFGPTMSTGAVGLLTISGANRTFRAVWTASRHTVTFVLSGGNVGGSTNNVLRQVDDGQNVNHSATTPTNSAPVPVLLNRVLQGWSDGAGGFHTPAAVGTVTINGPVTFTAVWDYDPVAVTFILDGGTAVVSGSSTLGPVDLFLPAGEPIGGGNVPLPTLVNHTFGGWSEVTGVPTPGSLTIRNHNEVADLVLAIGQPRTFTALWNPIQHPVTFVLSGGEYGGSGNNVVRTVNQGLSMVLSTPLITVPAPTNSPQAFLHWVSNDGTTWASLLIAVLPVTGPMTFTAVWDHQMVPITFDLAGGEYNGQTGLIVDDFPAGIAIGLGRVPIPTRTHYTFEGWRETDATPQGFTDRNRNQVAAIVVEYNIPRTFVAQWDRILHNVTFQLSGGSYNGNNANVVRIVRQGETILDPLTQATNTVPNPTNAPQVFQHWLRAGHPGVWTPASVAALTITGPAIFTAVWDYQRVDVTFDLNSGVYGANSGPITHNVRAGVAITLNYVPIPTRTNYTFVTWREYDNPVAGTNTDRSRVEVSQVVPVYNQPRVFVAQWAPILHPVTFQLDGGTYSGSNANVVRTVWQGRSVSDSTTTALNTVPAPARYPMAFQYWRLSGSNVQWSPASAAAMTVTGPAIFTAVWDYYRVDVTFDFAGGNYNGNLGPVTESLRVGVQIGLNYVPVPTRDNYTFVHWVEYDYPTAGTDTTRNRQQVSQVVPAYQQPRTFVAVWTPILHPVTFILEGGTYSGSPDNVVRIVNQGQNITHVNTTTTPTVPVTVRPFQTFMGWRNADGVIWQPSSVAALAVYGPRIFTAVWSADLVSVTFELEGGNVGGNTADIQLDLPSGFEIGLGNVPLPTRANYAFVTWQEAGQPNRDHHQVAAQVLQLGFPRVFTAVWEPIMHPATFVLAGGTYNGSTNAIIHMVQHNGNLALSLVPSPTNPPQAFQGWHVANTNMIWDATSVSALTITAPVTFTAVWEHSHASVTFVLAGGDFLGNPGPINHPMLPVGVEIGPGNVPVPTWEFRAFMYWAVMDGALVVSTHSALQVAEWLLVEDITFIAVWERMQFPVTFSFNGGSWVDGIGANHGDYFIRLYNNGALIMPNDVPIPTRVNYTLVGWRRDDIGQPIQSGAIEGLQVTGPMTFVAVWVRITHPVTFVMNGGEYEGSPGNFVWIVSQATEIERVPDPTREHFVLTGWREYDYPADGDYTDRNQGQVAVIEIFGPRTFVAQWERIAHPVTFDLAGGLFNSSPANVVNLVNQNDQIGTANIPTPTRSASVLTGWRMDGSGTILSAAEIALITVTEPMVFIAVWDANTIPVTFILAGGIYNGNQGPIVRSILEGAIIGSGVIPMPTRNNYNFAGWQREGAGATLSMGQVANITVTSPASFTAVWAPIFHPVTFELNGGNVDGSTGNIVENIRQDAAISEGNVPTTTRANATFTGWRENSTNILHSPTDVAALVVTGPMTFTAQWDTPPIPVIFDLDGGNVDGDTSDIEVNIAYGSAISGAVPEPVQIGRALTGWRQEGTTITLSPIQVAAVTVTEPMTFVAIWGQVEGALAHLVTFNLYGGIYQGSAANVVRQVPDGDTVGTANVPAPTRGTATFGGWREPDSTVTLTSAQVAEIKITGPRTFIAQWDLVMHTVTFVLTGGNVNDVTANIERNVPDGERIPVADVPQPTRDDYVLVGWTEDTDAGDALTGLSIAGIVRNRSYTYYAVWALADGSGGGGGGGTLPEFTLIFDPAQGSLPTGVADRVTALSGYIVDSFPTPTPPAGYQFVTWLYNGVQISAPMVLVRNMTVVASFAPATVNIYEVVHNPGAGVLPTGVQSTNRHSYGTQITNHPTPTRSGYTFGGWLLNGQPVANPLVVVSNKTLTAVWTPLPTPTPGTATPSPTPGTTATPAPSPSPTPAPGGHYTVIFNPYPGVHALATEHGQRTGAAGSVLSNIPLTPIRPGFVFAGWRLPAGTILVGDLVITGNKTLTAVWLPMVSPTPAASPTPTPGHPGNRPNPQTSPLQVSFMIFGAVMLMGVAVTGIWTLASKQTEAAGQFSKDTARYDREKRIVDMIKGDKPKK